ncbi:ABC transporter ATP-binding protein [Flavobacterium defluvii]|uniref:Lipopolysaccharide transport system ATP-binding protein n=1 Tax=Flavobacterium defluvii TaxID=370979 RepID=A0A1M5NVG5_9FLAO|nr:ABC transporter ATP-binding protein [Flavobacterium defluvii]SHG93497.1 lipopolysaccharide transport system ATP-binding protein [Flavobacterium defluvii]
MKDIILKAENVSKQYRLGEVGSGTISHDVNRWWYKIRGKENPYLKIGDTNDRSTKGSSDYVWALQDINFEVERGEVLGIIGKNGAGKSTLLKILSKVTAPTTGTIKSRGRIASLLEVGTGFNGEMTGRENIYLNGAILGMTKREITSKLDEIIDFSGCERYIDTPVKRYSSGMTVRLAFAVAAFLEPEILVVDEVLAVGDADFQKKAIGKMQDISKGEGRTILFVSHQLGSVATLCNKGMLMDKGGIVEYGAVADVIEKYLIPSTNESTVNSYIPNIESLKNKKIFFTKIETINFKNQITDFFGFNEKIKIRLTVTIKEDIKNVVLGIGLQDKFNVRVCTFMNNLSDIITDNSKDNFNVEVTLPNDIIAPNHYNFIFALYEHNVKTHDIIENACPIKIHDTGTMFSKFEGIDYGNVILDSKWKILDNE